MQKFLGNALIWTGLYLVWASSLGASGGVTIGGFALSLAIAIPLWIVGTVLVGNSEEAIQRESDRQAQLLLDSSPPLTSSYFLYLRPFDSTNETQLAENPAHNLFSTEVWERDGYDDIERVLSKALSPTAIFAAFGRPGEHRGAGRIFIPDEGWLDQVRRLAQGATLIVAMPSSSAGTMEELNLVKEQKFLSKTIFVMPPSKPSSFVQHDITWPERWAKMRAGCAALGLEMPPYEPSGRLFMTDGAGKLEARDLPGSNPRHWVKAIDSLLHA